jgi:hypothetical protein
MSLVVDKFANADANALGNYQGADEGMTLKYNSGKLTTTSTDTDYSFYTQVSGTCSDFSNTRVRTCTSLTQVLPLSPWPFSNTTPVELKGCAFP